ncbi:outer membrane beta-barrel protein [Aridibaculum aurantiacum]|uniref:outer membrane beta-barrel protein n=1 Tax=Aridibaculum aurantiacum TaxID=2810307 RepID=UPI001A95D3E5|nr:outer membrane beta-barrel protein [Aridibaculum aurantiacum]
MRRIYLAMAALLAVGSSFAQADTTTATSDTTIITSNADTVRIGNFTIIKKNRPGSSSRDIVIEKKEPKRSSAISTNWWIVDIGFANVVDRTQYGSPAANDYLRPIRPNEQPFTKDDLKLRTGKTTNVNIWVLMQRLNIHKGYVNLKYGVGLEMFNFRYENNISYHKSPSYIFRDSINFTKNKLYTGYLSVPLMLNFNTMPGHKKGLSFSAGITAGYLVGSRNKQVSGERGKEKIRGNFDLEQFRLAYTGELGIGPIRLFGSYSMTPLHERGLEQYPYSVGIRLSNW